jgi:hypothetical protein
MRATENQVKYLESLIRDWDEASKTRLLRVLNVESLSLITKEQASAVIDSIKMGYFKSNTEAARECMRQGLKVVEELGDEVSADKRAEITGRWGITFYLDKTR